MLVTFIFPISVQFLSNFCLIPTLFFEIPGLFCGIFPFVFHCAGNVRGHPTQNVSETYPMIARTQCTDEGGGVTLGEKNMSECARKINMSSSWSRKGLGRRAPIIIVIRTLNQPRTFEMGPSSFYAMILIKVASTLVHKLLASSLICI